MMTIIVIIIVIIITIIEIIVIAITKINKIKNGVIRTGEGNNMKSLFATLSLYSNVIILTNQLKFSVNKKHM